MLNGSSNRALFSIGVVCSGASAPAFAYVMLAHPTGHLRSRLERLFMGQTLAEFVSHLARAPQAEPESLMAAALRDPSLKIAYRRSGQSTYVDGTGAAVRQLSDQAVTWIERDHRPVAAVMYDRELSDYQRFVQAAGAAALIRLERGQLEADLKASTADLAASRVRLMHTAAAERRRLERDLHDGVQQHLVGLRVRLALAAEAINEDPVLAERLLSTIGTQMDDVLDEVRSLARGIYPTLLSQHGVIEALKAAGRSSTIPVEVRATQVVRYDEDLEVAVYFCCLEALQNAAKHAGPGATATVTLRQQGSTLQFEVRDFGVGFSPDEVQTGSGLGNMRDRIDAIGGTLEVSADSNRGTVVRGSVPVSDHS